MPRDKDKIDKMDHMEDRFHCKCLDNSLLHTDMYQVQASIQQYSPCTKYTELTLVLGT